MGVSVSIIRKLVLVNEKVTDFCCVLNFMDTKGSCTVFLYIVLPFLFITSSSKCCKNAERVTEKG